MSDPRIPRALRDDPEGAATPRDPLHSCIVATAALLAWLLGPAVVVLLALSAAAAYTRAWRAGRRTSGCYLGDVRLVLAYLVLVAVAAGAALLR